MTEYDEQTVEATPEQLNLLRELGVASETFEGMSYAEADALIAELEAEREDAGKIGRD